MDHLEFDRDNLESTFAENTVLSMQETSLFQTSKLLVTATASQSNPLVAISSADANADVHQEVLSAGEEYYLVLQDNKDGVFCDWIWTFAEFY